MKAGDYVRTKSGYIDKIININDFREPSMKYALEQPSWNDDIVFIGEEDIIKSSQNIINLIEVGDYVNGYMVENIDAGLNGDIIEIATGTNYFQSPSLYNEDIKSIVTKEMFSNVEYRVENN